MVDPDPYEFIVRESLVSSSQEELLKRIPGWQVPHGSASPSQTPLALSRLCGSGDSSSSSDDEREPAPASAFCMQEPLEWASPETRQDDSYNPAFESDRSRSLSPLAPLNVYGDLWASRLITQSQNDAVLSHLGVCDLPLVEEAHKKDPPQAAEVGFEVSCRQGKNVLLLDGQERNYKPIGLSANAQKQGGMTPSRDIPNGSFSTVEHEKDGHQTEILDGNGKSQNILGPVKAMPGDQLASFFDHTSRKKCVSVTVDEPAAGPSSFCIVENARKRKDEGVVCALATTTPKLKALYYEQQHINLANEANHHKVKGPLSTKQIEDRVAVSSDAKCLLPFVSDKENKISTHRMEESTCGETEMIRDNVAIDRTVSRVLPKSVMDVVVLVSETLPTPRPHDPDFLSIVMSTGVSLSLPHRDCCGRLISSKSVSAYKGSFGSGPT